MTETLPPEPKRQPGSHRHRVGDAETIVLADGYRTFPLPDTLVVNVDRATVNAALVAACMPADRMTIHFNPVVVRTGGRTVLVDTGNGPGAAAEEGSTVGWLPRSMAEAGLSAGDIETVVISHFHGDHINGLLTSDGEPAFPDADIRVPKAEWEFWMERSHEDDERLKGIAALAHKVLRPLESRITTFAPDEDAAPGLAAVATPGHTLGHSSFMLSSGKASLFIQSDVTNNPALFARNPGWHAAFDIDGEQAETVRREIYDMLAERDIPVLGFHYPFPALARIAKDGDGYAVYPLESL